MLDFVHRPQSPLLLVEPALMASGSPSLAVLRVRITRSQSFTDLIGPRYANAVLNVAIERLKSALHGDDSLLRMDKDELAVLLNPMDSVKEAEQVANEIIHLLQRPYLCRGKSARLKISVGVALAPRDGTDAETLLQRAETALYYADISHAQSAIVYKDDLEARASARHALARDLAHALQQSQLKLYYQPQFSIDRSRLLGFQTSLQWKHPHHGWISPSSFLPLAEEIGVMQELANWSLRTSCLHAAAGSPHTVFAVATCPAQFTGGTLLGAATAALSASGLEPGRLAIELPEQVLLNESVPAQSTIAALHRMGVRLVLANVGVSFSSLDLLGRFPFSSVTFDPTLIGQDSQHRSIVRAATMISRELGIATLAQGIETEEDLREAEMDGCTSAQGPLLGKIVPESQIPGMLSSRALETRGAVLR